MASVPDPQGNAAARRRLGRAQRLLKRGDFDRVYREGGRHLAEHMTVLFLRREAGAPRVGFTVGRALGGAVQRNRARRRLREAARLHLSELSVPVDVVIHPKKSALTAEFERLQAEVVRAFEKINRSPWPRPRTRKGLPG